MEYQDDRNKESIRDCSDEALLERTNRIAQTERKITHLVLLHISEVERRRLFALLGYSSMFDYLVKHLKYSEGSAHRRIHSARLLTALPELSAKIEAGGIKLTQLSKVQMMIKDQEHLTKQTMTREAKAEILNRLENKNAFETDRILSQVFAVPAKYEEQLICQSDGSTLLKITISNELLEKLRACRSIFSHVKHNSSWAEVIELQSDFVLKMKSPAREVRTRRARAGAYSKVELRLNSDSKVETTSKIEIHSDLASEASFAAEGNMPDHELGDFEVARISITQGYAAGERHRRFVRARNRREVFRSAAKAQEKDSGDVAADGTGCQYRSPVTGIRCGPGYQLQVDHKIPLALGGSNERENLRLLCRTHNLFEAQRLGLGCF